VIAILLATLIGVGAAAWRDFQRNAKAAEEVRK
jgi:hypothetical protein